jgi:hypothetical protein
MYQKEQLEAILMIIEGHYAGDIYIHIQTYIGVRAA